MHPLKSAVTAALLLTATVPAFALERMDLVPPDAQFEVHISDTTTFLEKLKKSSLGKLWADPLFQDFLGHPDADMLNEYLFDGEKTAQDEMMLEQIKMLKGEVVIAKVREEDTPYMILAMTDDDFRHSLILDDKMAETSKEPFDIVRDSFQDVDVIQHIEHAGTDHESRTWQAHLGNTLVMGPSKEWVEKSITRLRQEAIDEPEGNPVLDVNVPLATLIRESLKEPQDDPAPVIVDPSMLFESLGLLGIEKFTTHIELRDEDMIVDNNLQATSLGKGIFTLLDMEPAELPNVDFVPDNITLIEVGRVNLLRFWQEIPAVMTTAMPTVKPQLDMVLSTIRSQIGIDIEQDLLANMGTRYIAFSSPNGDMLASVMALELKDGSAFRNALETVMASPMVEPQVTAVMDTINFLDRTLYVSKTTEAADAIAFSVTGNYLLYGHPDAVRQVIRSQSSEAASNPRLEENAMVRGLRQHVPGTAFGYSAIDWKKSMPFIIRELTQPQRIRIIQERWARSGAALPPPDFNKLPPTDHLASFFNTSYLYIERTNQGLHQQIILKY